ncbi:MAG TPA: DMT family transporter [Candidatus Limnocylindria bacterium]
MANPFGLARFPAFIVALLGLQVALACFAVFAKEAIEVVPPLTLEGARRLSAGLLLLAFVGLTGRGWRPTRRDLADAVLPGLLGFGLGRACVMTALSMTSATNVAVIDSSAPAVALVLALLLRLERPRALAIGGSLVAFGGVLGLVLAGGGLGVPNVGDVLALGSPLAWGAIYVWMARRAPDPSTLLRRTAWFSLAGAAALAGPAVLPGPEVLGLLLDSRVVGVLVLGIGIGLFENALTFRGIAVLGAVATAELEYLVPALTAGIGLVILGTPVLPPQALAMAAVVGGLLVAGRVRHRDSVGHPLPGQPCCVT